MDHLQCGFSLEGAQYGTSLIAKISLCLQTDMKNIIQKLIFSAIILVMNSGGGGVR